MVLVGGGSVFALIEARQCVRLEVVQGQVMPESELKVDCRDRQSELHSAR